jgi:hypothetical protein
VESVITERFKKAFDHLPQFIQEKARKTYQLWRSEPFHPSLAFKQVSKSQPVYSVRIGLNYRSLGIREANVMIWFWIGSHEDYNSLIKPLQ